MYFTKNEIIELKGGKKHVVIDTTKLNGLYYYYVAEVDPEETKMIPKFKVITTIDENGYLFVKTIKDELEKELTVIFKQQLNLN